MSGTNRRSQYRKHLTDQVLNEFPEPDAAANECIAQITASRGGNLLEIQVDLDYSNNNNNSADHQLAILPSKFNKLVWVKRGDFLIVQGVDADEQQEEDQHQPHDYSNGNKVRFLVKHVLYKEQVKHLRSKPYWPAQFRMGGDDSCDCDASTIATSMEPSTLVADIDDRKIIMQKPNGTIEDEDYDCEYSSDNNDDSDLFVNTNRIVTLRVEDSSSSDEDD